MDSETVNYLNNVARFLKVEPGKIITDEDYLLRRTKNNSVTKGFINIILQFLDESQSEYCLKHNINAVINTQIWQWLEYCIVYAAQAKSHQSIHQILKELNAILKLKTYLVSNKLTIADIVLYYILYGLMCNLTPIEKEVYLNVSRWFDNIQQDGRIRQTNKLVNFSCNYIINSVASLHI
ncbi:hypothetical protein WA026_002470 [Henosepilachna vigintioctopunctata]|uniref:GST C-terminal domain-containing protein n=1 Tax=Henosepilachna vigintioctopunctata TaxID=420089 RepID=A0AAW1U0G5_9CUCU